MFLLDGDAKHAGLCWRRGRRVGCIGSHDGFNSPRGYSQHKSTSDVSEFLTIRCGDSSRFVQVQDTKRRPAIVYRGKQGRLCLSTLKPGHGAARFGGEADFELRGWIGYPRARHVIDAVAYLLVTGAIAIV